jgi:ribonuclease Y
MYYLIAGIAAGLIAGYFIRQAVAHRLAGNAEAKADKILEDAKNKEKDFLLRAKEKAIKIIDEAKEEEHERRQELTEILKLKSRRS